ncbi:hypothetical protein ACOMHN_044026 [Nucella lapillus]
MSEGGQNKRKSKGWYRKQAFHNKRVKSDHKPGHRLTAGLRGFIVTCNDRERDAVKESYNILNEYADRLYGPETKAEAEHSGDSDGDDIEAAIAKEVQELKETSAKGERRFQNCQSGAKNCIFIKTTLEDPVGLALAIFTDLRQTKQQKSRHALRLLPVVGTCKANVKEINDLAKEVLQPFFTDTKFEVTFTITFKARNNNGVGRDVIISTLRKTIVDEFPLVLLKFTHDKPEITVLVEVMCGVACIAVAREFASFRKYNLVEVVHDKPAEPAESIEGVQAENTTKMQGADSLGFDKSEAEGKERKELSCKASVSMIEGNARMQGADSLGFDKSEAEGKERKELSCEASVSMIEGNARMQGADSLGFGKSEAEGKERKELNCEASVSMIEGNARMQGADSLGFGKSEAEGKERKELSCEASVSMIEGNARIQGADAEGVGVPRIPEAEREEIKNRCTDIDDTGHVSTIEGNARIQGADAEGVGVPRIP